MEDLMLLNNSFNDLRSILARNVIDVKHGSFYFSKLLHWVAIVINQRKANYLIINYHLNHCIIGHYHP